MSAVAAQAVYVSLKEVSVSCVISCVLRMNYYEISSNFGICDCGALRVSLTTLGY